MMVNLRPGMIKERDEVIEDGNIQYVRNDFELQRGTFECEEILWIFIHQPLKAYCKGFFCDEIDQREIDRLQKRLNARSYMAIARQPICHNRDGPNRHYIYSGGTRRAFRRTTVRRQSSRGLSLGAENTL